MSLQITQLLVCLILTEEQMFMLAGTLTLLSRTASKTTCSTRGKEIWQKSSKMRPRTNRAPFCKRIWRPSQALLALDINWKLPPQKTSWPLVLVVKIDKVIVCITRWTKTVLCFSLEARNLVTAALKPSVSTSLHQTKRKLLTTTPNALILLTATTKSVCLPQAPQCSTPTLQSSKTLSAQPLNWQSSLPNWDVKPLSSSDERKILYSDCFRQL